MTQHSLDLRGIACPLNFVKTRLFLDKIAVGDVVEVLLDDGEPVQSVSASVGAEGHLVVSLERRPEGHCRLSIRKV